MSLAELRHLKKYGRCIIICIFHRTIVLVRLMIYGWLIDCMQLFIFPLENLFNWYGDITIQHCWWWWAADLDLYLAPMAIEQWGFFIVHAILLFICLSYVHLSSEFLCICSFNMNVSSEDTHMDRFPLTM